VNQIVTLVVDLKGHLRVIYTVEGPVTGFLTSPRLRRLTFADVQTTLFSNRRFSRQQTSLIDDSEKGLGDVGGSAFPTEQERRESPSYHPRPFTAWPTARDSETSSIWNRLARLFRRGASDNGSDNGAGVTAEPSVSPPSDFEFPWSSSDEAGELPERTSPRVSRVRGPSELPLLEPFDTVDDALPVADSVAASPLSRPFQSMSEADTDPLLAPATPADTQEVPRPPGFLARLFKRDKEEITEEVTAEAVISANEELNPDFLVAKFRAFYNEILNQKHQGSDITAGFATAIVSQDDASGESPEQAALALSARLQQMLELQQAQATWMGGETAARYPDAQYAMSVLADETLSSAEWKGSAAWPQNALEQKLFKSHAADLEFFRRVDRLFKEGPATPVSRDLARVYLLTIAAGFRGKYGAFGLTRPLHEYRQRLFEYIHGGDALLLYADTRKIFPDATAHTIAGKATARVSNAQRWIAVMIVVLVGYTVLAHLAWNRASADLRDVTARVEATNSAGAR
jgi:type VI secretion system protein ImpK